MRRVALLLALLSTTALGGDDEIDELISRLGHGMDVVKWDSTNRLREMGAAAEPALPALLDAMREDVLWADDALVAIGAPAVPGLNALLAIPGRRVDTVRALGKLGPAAAAVAPSIAKLLNDRDQEVRVEACIALGRIGSRTVEPALTAALRDRSPAVRACAAAALFAMGADTLDALSTAIDAFTLDPSIRVQNALIRIGPPCIEPLLRKSAALDDSTREQVCRIFEELGARAKPATAHLIDIVAKDLTAGASLRQAAAEALAAIGLDDVKAIEELKGRLIDPACCEPVLEALATLGEPAVPTIAGVLELGIDDAQRAAARVLYELGPSARAARTVLRNSLSDSQREVSVHAAFALLRIDPDDRQALFVIRQRTSQGEADWRRLETGKFVTAGPTAVAALTKWLSDENERLRTMAAVVFARPPRESPFPVEMLVAALKDDQFRVRVWAARALANAGDKAESALRGAMMDPVQAVRIAAVLSLADAGLVEKADTETLIEALRHGEETESIQAMQALGKLAAAEAVPDLIQFSQSDEDYLAEEARDALIAIGKPAVPMLMEEMDGETLARIGEPSLLALLRSCTDPDADTRRWSVWLLGQFRNRPEVVIPALARLLDDPEPSVRIEAAEGLGGFGARAKSSSLAKLKATLVADPAVFDEVAAAIWAIGQEPALVLPAIRKRLESDDSEVRVEAIKLLSDVAPHEPEADAMLRSLLEDEDEYVRLKAAYRLAANDAWSDRVVAVLTLGLTDGVEFTMCGLALWDTGALAKALRHDHPGVRVGAAGFMARSGIPGPEEAEALRAALAAKDPALRALAATAFVSEPSYSAGVESALAKLLGDRDATVVAAAAQALSANGVHRADSLTHLYAAMGRKGMPIELAEVLGSRGAEVVPELTRYVKEGTEQERVFAALALGHVGRAASPALDLLMELSEKGEGRIRLAAGLAVRRILVEMPPTAIGIGGRSGK